MLGRAFVGALQRCRLASSIGTSRDAITRQVRAVWDARSRTLACCWVPTPWIVSGERVAVVDWLTGS